MTDEAKALVELQRAAGLKNLPTSLTHDLRIAVSGEGPRAYDWRDKPHRLLYDTCAEIETQAREIERLRIALHEIDIEAANTIPPDGKDAAFAALFRIAQIINPFRLPRAALARGSYD